MMLKNLDSNHALEPTFRTFIAALLCYCPASRDVRLSRLCSVTLCNGYVWPEGGDMAHVDEKSVLRRLPMME